MNLSFLCGFWFIGHSWKDATPPKLMHTQHRRVECRRCTIQRWRFRTDTQEELDKIMSLTTGMNRTQRRNALNAKR
jgi:hypothetical protein